MEESQGRGRRTADMDHDLLIRLDEKVNLLLTKVDALTNDHEARIRRLERWGTMALGAIALFEFAIRYFK